MSTTSMGSRSRPKVPGWVGRVPTALRVRARWRADRRAATLSCMEYAYLVVGIVLGVVLGTLVVGLVSIGSYDRGYRHARRVTHTT